MTPFPRTVIDSGKHWTLSLFNANPGLLGGPGHVRGCIFSSDEVRHTSKAVSEMKRVDRARKVGS